MMLSPHRVKLLRRREEIVNDLDVDEVIDKLISEGVLTPDLAESILTQKGRREKARHLLDVLPQRGPYAFDIFVEALKPAYPWLAGRLLLGEDEADNSDAQSLADTLLLGGLPRSPTNNVERTDKLNEIRAGLKDLKRGEYLVLHGMTGSGKSCLAAAAIDRTMLDIFKHCVFWLSVRDAQEEEVASQQELLLGQLGHFLASDSGRPVVSSTQYGLETLRRMFIKDPVRDGLVILDDVTTPELVEAFDIGCRIMITTRDTDVMKNVRGHHNMIKVNEGFTEEESLTLLAKCVGVSVSELPPQAKKIHDLCKGIPMVMALIGGQLEDSKLDVRKNFGRWNYYVDKLAKRDYRHLKRQSLSDQDGMFQAIGMSIESLPSEYKKYYYDFCLFVEDVNITPQVLETLWSLNKYEVEDIMYKFMKKSLAVSKWVEALNSYVYGIHDLLLCYLNMQLAGEKQELHKKLLNAYRTVCGGNFAHLPADNYIFSYIGYHLSEAHLYEEFPSLYLDLEFVEAKIKNVGPGDLLLDYRKYRHYITRNNDEYLMLKLSDYEQFVQWHGLVLYKYQDIDIVQCGLQQPSRSIVYQDAMLLANTRPHKLYLEFMLEQDIISQPHTYPVGGEILAACFTTDQHKILVANNTGKICMWDLKLSKVLWNFHGHSQCVLHLELSPDEFHFLSASEDGCVKVWHLNQSICETNNGHSPDENGSSLKTPSPRLKQPIWSSMFSVNGNLDESQKTLRCGSAVVYATFSNSKKEIMCCTKNGAVQVWEYENEIIRLTLKVSNKEKIFANCSLFSSDDSLLLFGGNDAVVHIHDAFNGEIMGELPCTGNVVAILGIPGSSSTAVVVASDSIIVWTWEESKRSSSNNSAHLYIGDGHIARNLTSGSRSLLNVKSQEMGHRKTANYVTGTITPTGQFVITSSTRLTISVWDIEEATLVREYHDHSGWVRCLDTFWTDEQQLLLSGSDDRTVKLWPLDLEGSEHSTKLQTHYDAVWRTDSLERLTPLIAVPDTARKLQVLRGKTVVAETVPEKVEVTTCRLSVQGDLCVYGCKDGHVKLFHIATKECSLLMKLSGAVHYLQLCGEGDDMLVVAGGLDGSLKLWRQNSHVQTCAGQTDRVVQCFPLLSGTFLLSCSGDRSVKLWDTTTGELAEVVVGRKADVQITMTDLSAEQQLLAMSDAKGSFVLVKLDLRDTKPFVTAGPSTTYHVSEPVECCRFSPEGRLLALGQRNGEILLWHVEKCVKLTQFLLHEVTVRSLQFGPDMCPLLLTSVGEQVAWWNVTEFLTETPQRRRRSQSRRRIASTGTSPAHLTLNLSANEQDSGEALSRVWDGKTAHVNRAHLLGCIKLIGSHATHVSASRDWSAFVTIDSSGVVYLMRVH